LRRDDTRGGASVKTAAKLTLIAGSVLALLWSEKSKLQQSRAMKRLA